MIKTIFWKHFLFNFDFQCKIYRFFLAVEYQSLYIYNYSFYLTDAVNPNNDLSFYCLIVYQKCPQSNLLHLVLSCSTVRRTLLLPVSVSPSLCHVLHCSTLLTNNIIREKMQPGLLSAEQRWETSISCKFN